MIYRPSVRLYQLRNLAKNSLKYVILDLDASIDPFLKAHPHMASLLSPWFAIDAGFAFQPRAPEVFERLVERGAPRNQPVILCAADRHICESWQDELERAGWENVFILDGGLTGLLSDLEVT